jgi:hypothetical protein
MMIQFWRHAATSIRRRLYCWLGYEQWRVTSDGHGKRFYWRRYMALRDKWEEQRMPPSEEAEFADAWRLGMMEHLTTRSIQAQFSETIRPPGQQAVELDSHQRNAATTSLCFLTFLVVKTTSRNRYRKVYWTRRIQRLWPRRALGMHCLGRQWLNVRFRT